MDNNDFLKRCVKELNDFFQLSEQEIPCVKMAIATGGDYKGIKGEKLKTRLRNMTNICETIRKMIQKYPDDPFVLIGFNRVFVDSADDLAQNYEWLKRVEQMRDALAELNITDHLLLFDLGLMAYPDLISVERYQYLAEVFSQRATTQIIIGTISALSANKRMTMHADLLSKVLPEDELIRKYLTSYTQDEARHNQYLDNTAPKNDPHKKRIKNHRRWLEKAFNYLRDNRKLFDFHYYHPQVRPETFASINSAYTYGITLASITDYGAFDVVSSEKAISEEMWLEALELALAFRHPDLFTEIQHGKISIKKHYQELEEIAPLVSIFAYLIFLIRELGSSEMFSMYCMKQKYGNDDFIECDKVDNTAEEYETLLRENRKLTSEIEQLKIANRSMKQLIESTSGYSRAAASMQHEHNQELKEKNQEIEQLKARILQLEAAQADAESTLLAVSEEKQENKPWLDIELPESGVVFVGGHPNMVKKIAFQHPKWTFIADNISAGLPPKAEVIFLWTNHLSHPLWYRINEFYHGRESFCYLTATNIDRLYEEMKFNLWKTRS